MERPAFLTGHCGSAVESVTRVEDGDIIIQ